jgi:hypothetical protein
MRTCQVTVRNLCRGSVEKCVKEEIDKIAKLEDRSGSSMINWILKKYINEYNSDKEK